jgi:hypothetical protein
VSIANEQIVLLGVRRLCIAGERPKYVELECFDKDAAVGKRFDEADGELLALFSNGQRSAQQYKKRNEKQ